jgi:hypothetical protein
LPSLSAHKIHAYELGSEKTGKPASVSIAGFFFGPIKIARQKKAHRNEHGGLKSILWEGGGDKENYSQFPGIK